MDHRRLPVHARLQLAYAPYIELGYGAFHARFERKKVSKINGKAQLAAWFT
jgi:hypothetical protein